MRLGGLDIDHLGHDSRPDQVWSAVDLSKLQAGSAFHLKRAVDGADHAFDRGEIDTHVDAGAVEGGAVLGLDLNVADGLRPRAGAERVLGVVEELELEQTRFADGGYEGVDRTIADLCCGYFDDWPGTAWPASRDARLWRGVCRGSVGKPSRNAQMRPEAVFSAVHFRRFDCSFWAVDQFLDQHGGAVYLWRGRYG